MGRCPCQGNYSRDVRAVLEINPLAFLEVLHLPGDLHLEALGVEVADTAHATDAVTRRVPERLPPDAVRTDCSNSGDNNSSHREGLVSLPLVDHINQRLAFDEALDVFSNGGVHAAGVQIGASGDMRCND